VKSAAASAVLSRPGTSSAAAFLYSSGRFFFTCSGCLRFVFRFVSPAINTGPPIQLPPILVPPSRAFVTAFSGRI
jgi:hypothetical protein